MYSQFCDAIFSQLVAQVALLIFQTSMKTPVQRTVLISSEKGWVLGHV